MSESGRPRDVWKNPAARGRSGPAGPGPRPAARRWLVAGLVVAALCGTIAGLFIYLWPDRPPVVRALPVADHLRPDWPPDPWAAEDARAFVERAGGEGAQAAQAQEKGTLVRELNAVAAETRGRPVVVLLTALGVSEGGKVALVPGDARPDDPGTWLPLDEVLSPLRRAAAPLLLILDVRPVTDPRAVVTGEDVNAALGATLAALDRAGDLPFFVLSAHNPPDGANELRALRRTAFGLALAQGAGGEADGWNADRKRDGRVSVRELAAYVRELTHHASAAAGLPAQLPQLYGAAADFDAFLVPRGGPPALPAPAEPEPYPDFLAAAWTDRDAWRADGLHLRAPRLVRHLTLTTVRAERRWLTGGDLAGIRGAFDPPASRLREERLTHGPVVPPIHSIARARQKPSPDPNKPAPDPAIIRATLQPVFAQILLPPGPQRDAALGPATAAACAKPLEGDALDAAAVAIFSFARDLEQPTPQQMTHLAALVGGIKPRRPGHAELAAVALVGGLPPDDTRRWPPQAVRILLDATARAEEAAAIDGTALPWVADDLARADQVRRTAVRELCDRESTREVRSAAVAALDAVRTDFRAVRATAEALARARDELEGTRAILTDLADAFPFDSVDADGMVAKRWRELTEDYSRVGRLLVPPPRGGVPPKPAELDAAAGNLSDARTRLLERLQIPDAAGLRQLEVLSRWPGWSYTDRKRLLAKLAEADRAAARKVLDGWLRQPPDRAAAAVGPPGPPPAAAARRVLERKLAVLKLADGKTAGALAAELAGLGADPEPAALAGFARKVRLAGRRELAETYAAADPAAQALMGWAVDPDDAPAFPSGAPGPTNPEPVVRRAAETEFYRWLDRTRYAKDAAALDENPAPAARDAAAWYRSIGRAYAGGR
jgi:hypothetical protein